jgi:hypothetical protein
MTDKAESYIRRARKATAGRGRRLRALRKGDAVARIRSGLIAVLCGPEYSVCPAPLHRHLALDPLDVAGTDIEPGRGLVNAASGRRATLPLLAIFDR